MDIHEYQAKEILAKFGVTVPAGALVYSPEQVAYRARELGGGRWIVKAQVHAGGRGKAGGVKLCNSEHEIQEATDAMFGRKIVTHQTGPEGKGIFRVYVENARVPFHQIGHDPSRFHVSVPAENDLGEQSRGRIRRQPVAVLALVIAILLLNPVRVLTKRLLIDVAVPITERDEITNSRYFA